MLELNRTIEHGELSEIDKANAYLVAQRFRARHGYWMALYNVMTLLIWCRKGNTQHWSNEELINITFWWRVRTIIYNGK